ncbi:MAG: recombination mediator RecR [Polyangiaceae bacterium]|nr:recombination mediator RecR [Polyangiaceae bacterium]
MLPIKLTRLIQLLSRFPGVGEKTAQRFALYLIQNQDLAAQLGKELTELSSSICVCERCGNIAERANPGPSLCRVCQDPRREARLLCIVARVQDLLAIERSGAMRGRYFVLGRLLSPLDGIGPEELPLRQLLTLTAEQGVEEAIIATPPSVDGEATALFLARELGKRGVKLTRIASGIPHGGDLEFADQITLGRAIDDRRTLGS